MIWIFPVNFIQIYPVSEGYLRKIPVERRGKYAEPLKRREKFDCPRNRYFSQTTLTNRIYLFNSAEYLTASKTVACKQVQNFRPPRSFDFQLRLKINLRKQEKSFQWSDQFWKKFKNKINHGFALTYNTLKKNNANEFEIYTFQRFQT